MYHNSSSCCPWSHGLRPKKLSVSVAVPSAPVRVPSQRPLALSITSVISVANDKGENEMILGAVHRSPGICLTAEENRQEGRRKEKKKKGMGIFQNNLLSMEPWAAAKKALS